MINRLMFALIFVVGTTLMGIGVTIALNTGFDSGMQILIAAAAGFALSVPVSWQIARSISRAIR